MRKTVALLISGFLAVTTLLVNAEEKKQVPSTPSKPAATTAAVKTNTLSIYENPAATSKVVATVSQTQPLISIFQQGDWVKVANPQDGMVGWMPKTNLTNATAVTITQQMPGVHQFVITENAKEGSPGNVYRVIQYSNNNQLTPQQVQAIFDRIQLQQRKMQADFNQMISDAFRNMGQPFIDNAMPKNFPILPPVIIIQQPEKPVIPPVVAPKPVEKNKQ